ncbi:hypothetical protein BDV25DRAFT_27931 [Aspergillus avenaceus]|uniref:Uncharacterized protein n=1 Tax=Aspergillus avenaceus TaxID=36643 RepID=A0A5N6U4J2_ASPAV|nr:hypothetical protein BDV25DRAFT_27931 [Aspergillus avenaceus]
MSLWPIFITAPNATPKQINKALIELDDYEYGASSSWVVVHTSEPPITPTASIPPLAIPELTSTTNFFAGKAPQDVHAYVQDPATRSLFSDRDLTTYHWVAIDEKGLGEETCLLAQYEEGREPDADGEVREFKMCRIPWASAWSMFCNLDLANMDFEEWVEEDVGPVEEDFGAWKWVGPFSGGSVDEEAVSKRKDRLATAEKEGYI